jgi:hypothetical protein
MVLSKSPVSIVGNLGSTPSIICYVSFSTILPYITQKRAGHN